MQGNASVGQGCAGSVFYVSQNGQAGFGQLCADLVETAGFQVDVKQIAVGCVFQQFVVQDGFFRAGFGFQVGKGPVGFAVFTEVMGEGVGVLGWQGAYEGSVGFLGGFGAELFVHAGQGFGGAGQQDYTTYGSVQAVNETHEGFAGFVVFGGKVIRDYIQQVHITGYIALYGKSGGFVHRNEVVVFVKNFGLHGAKVVKTGLICEPSGFGAYSSMIP